MTCRAEIERMTYRRKFGKAVACHSRLFVSYLVSYVLRLESTHLHGWHDVFSLGFRFCDMIASMADSESAFASC